jgi:hypothetical protein
MSRFEISVTGIATIRTEGASGLVRETEIDHETITIEGNPVAILTDGPAAIEIEEIEEDQSDE